MLLGMRRHSGREIENKDLAVVVNFSPRLAEFEILFVGETIASSTTLRHARHGLRSSKPHGC